MSEEKRYKILMARQKIKSLMILALSDDVVDLEFYRKLKKQHRFCDNLLKKQDNKIKIAN